VVEATDLFQNPDRPPGWVLRDPATLQAWGQASRQNIRGIIALAADRPRLFPKSVQDKGAARMIEDYYDFPMDSDF
jgi:hypothetical protein